MIIIENSFLAFDGASEATSWVDEEAKIHMVYQNPVDGKLYHSEQQLPVGGITPVTMLPGIQFAGDRRITQLVSRQVARHKTWFLWIDSGGGVKEAIHVDEPYEGEAKSPYKLYYAVDTERLFMNIDDVWEFIGSPDVFKLRGTDQLVRVDD